MLDTLITSKTRIKLLVKFFTNPGTRAYLRGLAQEFNDSSNSVRVELNRLEESRLLDGQMEGNRKWYKANTAHPMFAEITSIVHKYFGLDVIIDNVLGKLGNLERVYLTGDLAKGMDTKVIELIFVGQLDEQYLKDLIAKAESIINRKIEYVICQMEELTLHLSGQKNMLIFGE